MSSLHARLEKSLPQRGRITHHRPIRPDVKRAECRARIFESVNHKNLSPRRESLQLTGHSLRGANVSRAEREREDEYARGDLDHLQLSLHLISLKPSESVMIAIRASATSSVPA